jgi:hypothetical protein
MSSTSTVGVAGTTPYPWPYDGALEPARVALVICGHDGEWAGRCTEVQPVVALLDRLASRLLDARVLVIRVRHRPAGTTVTAPPGRLAGDPRVQVSTAAGVDGFFGSDLEHRLHRTRRDHLLVAGFGLEATVHSTMRSANDRGFECLLLADASAPLDESLTGPSLHMVEMSGGIFGAVGTTAALLAALHDQREEIPT